MLSSSCSRERHPYWRSLLKQSNSLSRNGTCSFPLLIALFNNGHDPSVKDGYGRTSLSWAAEKGHEAVVKLLLANDNVDPDSKDMFGQTPLSLAAANGHAAVRNLRLATEVCD